MRDLPFAGDAVRRLARVLEEHYGYRVEALTDPGLRGADIDARVRQAVTGAGPGTRLVVLVLAHGRTVDSQHLYALGVDGEPVADVGAWLQLVQARGRPLTLFLLDTCESGAVARLPWLGEHAEEALRAWTLTACEPDTSAFDAVFTDALANVLEGIALGHLKAAGRTGSLPLKTLARAVRSEVTELRHRTSKWPQRVVGTRVDMADDVLERLDFFTVPAAGRADARVAGGLDPSRLGLAEAPDEGLDLPYLLDRAAGFGTFADPGEELVGCFSGRARELGELMSWLDGGAAGPAIVAGGPGSGKSALLSVLVCAAHPLLRDATRPLWRRLAHIPQKIAGRVAVVNCHQRDLGRVSASLGRQLGLPEEPAELVAALAASAEPCTVFVDAMDEADDPARVGEWLCALAETALPDGRPSVRLLATTRKEPVSARLRGIAGTSGLAVDLDDIDPRTLEADLDHYVGRLLRAVSDYGDASALFAARTARRLARAERTIGPFLAAGIHARRFVDEFERDADDPDAGLDEARRFGDRAPLDAAELFRAESRGQAGDSWEPPVLAVIAHARGAGMPASLIARCAARIRPGLPPPGPAKVQRVLRTRGYYLQRSADADGLVVYRPLHDELARHLRRTVSEEDVLGALLAPLGPAGARHWHAAEPYLLRHVLDHARGTPVAEELLDDPGFLLYADAEALAAAPDVPGAAAVKLVPGPGPFARRRERLALAAVLADRPDLAARAADLPGEEPLAWRPFWAEREGAAEAAAPEWMTALRLRHGRLLLAGPGGEETVEDVTSFALVDRPDLRGLFTVDRDDRLLLHEKGRARPVPSGSSSMVTSLAASTAGSPTRLFTGHHVGAVYSVDPRTGAASLVFEAPGGGRVRQVVTGGVAPAVVAYLVEGGVLGARRQDGGGEAREYRFGAGSRPLAVAVGGSRTWTAVVTVNDDGPNGSVTVFDYATFDPVTFPLPWPLDASHGLAVAWSGGRTVVLVGGPDGGVRLFSAHSHEETCTISPGLGRLTDIAVRECQGRVQCLVTGELGASRVECSAGGSVHRCERIGSAPAEAAGLAGEVPRPGIAARRYLGAIEAGERTVVVLADTSGPARCLDLLTGEPVLPPLPPDGEPVLGLETRTVGDVPAAVLRTVSTRRYWNLLDGSSGSVKAAHEGPDQDGPASPSGVPVLLDRSVVMVRGDAEGRVLCGDRVLGRHAAEVTALIAIRLDGAPAVVSGARDGSVVVWSLPAREPVGRLHVDAPVTALLHTPDGVLLVGAGNGTVAFRRGGHGGAEVR
ncbi:hypothetical protein ACQEU3_37345 [Spirillospora sp. CA-253888]